MGSFKQAEIDYSGLDNPNCAHYVNPQTKKAVNKYNPETEIYKLWMTRRHVKMFDTIDVYNDIAKGNKTLYANIMLLVQHTGTANLIVIRKRNRFYPANSEKALMEILGVKKSTWSKLRPQLFEGDLPILCTTTLEIDNKTYLRYFLNPLIGTYYRGISIVCYMLFRDYLKDFLSTQDFNELEYWASEYMNKDEDAMLTTEMLKYDNELRTKDNLTIGV